MCVCVCVCVCCLTRNNIYVSGLAFSPQTQLSRTVSAGPAKTAAPKAAGGGAGFIRPSRAARRNHVVVQRACPWGFQSLRPVPPMSSQDLIALRDVSVLQLKLAIVRISGPWPTGYLLI